MVTAAERRNYTRKMLIEKGQVSVAELSRKFNVSEVTVRKDLSYLESYNMLLRTRGGAILPNHFSYDRLFEKKAEHKGKCKRAIGKAAAGLIKDNETLFLDAGTTTMQVALSLEDQKNLTVVTNAIDIGIELSRRPHTEVFLLGGPLRSTSASVVGHVAEKMIRNLKCSKLFLAVEGFHLDYGLTTTNPLEAQVSRLMIEVVEQTIVVTDASKFGRRELSRICFVNSIDRVISDWGISEEVVIGLKKRDVLLQVAMPVG